MRVYSLSLWLRVAFRFRRAFLRRKREDVSDELRDLRSAQAFLERGHRSPGDSFGDQVCQVFGGEFAVAQFRPPPAHAPGAVAISHTAGTEVDPFADLDLDLGALRLRGARLQINVGADTKTGADTQVPPYHRRKGNPVQGETERRKTKSER